MKVKTLIDFLNECCKKYPDFNDWEVYTEQPDLTVPEQYKSLSETRQELEEMANDLGQPFNDEYWNELIKSKERMEELEKYGWHFVTDSEGWVFRDCAAFNTNDGERANCTIFEDKKVVTINNNY